MNPIVRWSGRQAVCRSAVLLVLFCTASVAGAADFKIGIVNVNKVLNTSDAGERSKKILLAAKSQKENDLKEKDAQFRKQVDDTRTNMMLSDAAKAQKEKELQTQQEQLQQEVQNAQHDLQEQERKLTESVFAEIRTVIAIIGQEKKYDLILEQGASQVILYSQLKMDDLTDEVIDRYNKIQGKKP
jgi:outer membrane protein